MRLSVEVAMPDGAKIERTPSGLEMQKIFDAVVITEEELTSEAERAWQYGDAEGATEPLSVDCPYRRISHAGRRARREEADLDSLTRRSVRPGSIQSTTRSRGARNKFSRTSGAFMGSGSANVSRSPVVLAFAVNSEPVPD